MRGPSCCEWRGRSSRGVKKRGRGCAAVRWHSEAVFSHVDARGRQNGCDRGLCALCGTPLRLDSPFPSAFAFCAAERTGLVHSQDGRRPPEIRRTHRSVCSTACPGSERCSVGLQGARRVRRAASLVAIRAGGIHLPLVRKASTPSKILFLPLLPAQSSWFCAGRAAPFAERSRRRCGT